ncbi:MAG: DUF4156 domain-containing protein [Gammaproteobacteria bacterium]|nr:DUF4156 domain-containing protein [Gammaproteobacteria bacterium]
MQTSPYRCLLEVALLLALTSCSWVRLTTEGEKIRVLSIEEVKNCDKKGQTTVSLLSKIGPIERKAAKIKKELEVLARNSAPDLDGDTVVAVGEIEQGKQTFDVFRCVTR